MGGIIGKDKGKRTAGMSRDSHPEVSGVFRGIEGMEEELVLLVFNTQGPVMKHLH